MELNHVFLFITVASSVIVLWQSFLTRNAHLRALAAIVLVIALLGWLFAGSLAGWLAAAAWFALLVVPAWRRHRRFVAQHPSSQSRLFAVSFSPCVVAFLLINIAAFIAEILLGGPTDPIMLHRLGWLDTDFVLYSHQYWRLLTALFLHYGMLHLVVNMFALLMLGPPLERQIGALFFGGCYILSGLGSSLTVVLLAKWRASYAVQLVGASGCVMGVVGVWAGFLLRNRHTPLAPQRLRSIIMIVVLQVIFDLVTPRVSMSAHLGGLITGFLLGLALPSSQPRHIIRFR
jgi:membrane associated rhomboid family serine protease